MIRHMVFFTAKDKADLGKIEQGLALLTQIPAARRLEIARNTNLDVLSEAIDIVVYGEFDDEASLAAYKAHPLYAQAIVIVRPLRQMRIAADIVAADAAI